MLNHIIIMTADTIDHNKVTSSSISRISSIISIIIESSNVARDNFTVVDDSIDTTETPQHQTQCVDKQWKWSIDLVMMEPRKVGRSRLRSRLFQDRFYEDKQEEFVDLEQ